MRRGEAALLHLGRLRVLARPGPDRHLQARAGRVVGVFQRLVEKPQQPVPRAREPTASTASMTAHVRRCSYQSSSAIRSFGTEPKW